MARPNQAANSVQPESALPAPSISLPKGGGAIRGIGEKFAANPVTGTGSMSVPIYTTPGRSRFGPTLSLSYDSGVGNGPFGFGWLLDQPQIARKTDQRLPQYNDADESDVFVLSGSEDLVPLLNPDGSRYEDTETVPGFTIHRYLPRIEGLFARIERWTRADGDVHWCAVARDNTLTLYGKDANSRIVDPADSRRIFKWLICETRDDKGNAVVYEYRAEDGAGVDPAHAHERNRGEASDPRRTSNRYLKHVRYGNRLPLLDENGRRPRSLTSEQIENAGWMFQLVFDYGEHDAAVPTPSPGILPGGEPRPWRFRMDNFSSHRAGFEVRTTRLCQRVLMFHHFEDEPGVGRDCLVRSTDFTYSDEQNPDDARNPVYSFLLTVTHAGYKRVEGGYSKRVLPPVEFSYSQPVVQEAVLDVDGGSVENVPAGLDDLTYHWIDLHGEGIPGIVTEQGGAWFYKRNLSPINATETAGTLRTEARFGPLEMVAVQPHLAVASGAGQFFDLAGDGLPDVVVLDGPTPGLYEHDDAEGWQPFQPFASRLNRDMLDANLKFVDLDGDGRVDVLVSEDDAFVWHPSLAEAGFGPARRVPHPLDEEQGPRLVFADGTRSIYLADLSGDGLSDVVRIRNGEVCYWPNLGYGRFGAKVTMDHAPTFDAPDQFEPSRIRLADIDGTGTTDIVYLHADGVRLYFNQSGNSWSEPKVLRLFPHVTNLSAIVPADLLGNGTACLVWSSPLPADASRPMRYVNLMGGQKPHMLVKIANNLGAETSVAYAPSTKFYLQDRLDGRPWITRLPFPVHVVERITTYDAISRNRFVTRFAYHHGYFDGEEREFRGFAMVEQFDSESFDDYADGVREVDGHQELAPELFQSPVTTRTWYHTGALLDSPRIMHQCREEYYRREQFLPDVNLPDGLGPQELRECARALKGLPLRQEIYSFDGAAQQEHPYTVVENTFEIRLLQPLGRQKNAVFFPTGRESISLNFERNPLDPRITHHFDLEVDERGNARKACAVVYGRQVADPSLPPEVTRDQQKRYVTYRETEYTADLERGSSSPVHRLRVAFESRTYEITGIAPAADLFGFGEIRTKIAGTAEIGYEATADGLTPQRRLLAQTRVLFRDDALNPLPLGEWDSLGLVHQNYQLAFTAGTVAALYGDRVPDADLIAAGYLHFDGDPHWWIPSGTAVYPAAPADHFYRAMGATDALGVETIATFDRYDLLVERVQVTQAPWNHSTARNDYRFLGPVMMTDANGNRTAIEIDELGLVTRTATMGTDGALEGDTLTEPTARIEYELFNWRDHRKPNFVHTLAREQHGAANPRWQESYAYSNGGGSVAMVKSQAHPGKALQIGEDGTVIEVVANPRWVGNGRTILNNKGNPVKQYEPYFSPTHEYEDEAGLREIGVTPIHQYDAAGRRIRTLLANGTFTTVEFDPWMQRSFDANDTVRESQWYADRGSPDPGAEPEPVGDPERRAAWLAAKHANTPSTLHLDSLGRTIYAVTDHGGGTTAAVRSESDLTGRLSRIFDQRGREVASGFNGMAGHPIVGETAEKGRRWILQNVFGAPAKTWDEHGREFRAEYDSLHRLLAMFAKRNAESEVLLNYVVYGDRLPNAASRNLLGVAHQIFDQGGMVRVVELDFKGNPKRVERILAREYRQDVDWSALAEQPDVEEIQEAAESGLEVEEIFAVTSEYDALNRPTRIVLPDDTVIIPTYNEANFLSSLRAQIRGEGSSIEFLRNQDYDAKGQRQFAHYGNDVLTRYFYDPLTFRLVNLVTHRSGVDPAADSLQDLRYVYDPAGNVTGVRDAAQQTHYFNNAVVPPESLFEYDAVYQLVRATGREHAIAGNDAIRTHTDLDFVPQLPHANDAGAVRTYTEEYEYDLLGNVKFVRHRFPAQGGSGSGWTRRYRYAFEDDGANRTNRLVSSSMPGDPDAGPFSATYGYDASGNMTRMPHLSTIDWNFMDQFRRADLGGGGEAFYVYGLTGQRLRKVIERNGSTKLEWLFLGPVTICRRRRRDTNAVRLERWTVHIADQTGCIAQVDTKTRDEDGEDPDNPLNTPLVRYQHSNLIGSTALELDEDGVAISYEEYHPYGTTAYRSAKPRFDLSLKRYRFGGKERDEETGLYYHGARCYAPWLGRWISTDPAGFTDGVNLFRFARNNPITYGDPSGMEPRITHFNADPPEIAYSGTRQQALDYFNNNPLVGTARVRFDDGEERDIPMSVRVRARAVTRQTQGGDSVNAGRQFWQVTDFTFVAGSWEILSDTSEEGEEGGQGTGDAGGEGAGAGGEGGNESGQGAGNAASGNGEGEGGSGRDQGAGTGAGSSQDDEGDRVPIQPNPGASTVSTYDSVHRHRYTQSNRARADRAVQGVRDATRANESVRAWETAREASNAREAARRATQGRLSPGGRTMSEAIDAGRNFESSVGEYSTRAPGGKPNSSPTRYAYTIAERVAEGSGRSNVWMTRVAKGGRVAGPIGIGVGLGIGIYNVANAPEGQRGRVAAGEIGNFVGGAVGFTLGMKAGVALAGGVTAFLAALGIVSNPVGWVIGLGLLFGVLGAWAFGSVGRAGGEAAYDAL